jgi:hypothetical protein
MLSHTLTHLLVEARVEELHRARRNYGPDRGLSLTASEDDRSPTAAFATFFTRTITRVFDGRRSAADEAAAIHRFELVGHGSTATWSRQS